MKFVSLTWMWVSDRGCWVRVLVVMTVEEAGPVGELAPALLGPGGAPVQVGWNDAFGVHDGLKIFYTVCVHFFFSLNFTSV